MSAVWQAVTPLIDEPAQQLKVSHICSVASCEKTAASRGLCGMHRSRLRRHGAVDGRAFLADGPRFWHRVDKTGDCWIWQGYRAVFGHGMAQFDGRPQRTHRIAWQLTYGPIPDDLCVLHHCDNPPCVNPDHLFLGTRADNIYDMWSKGRAAKLVGEDKPHSKLTDRAVEDIRKLRSDGWPVVQLAQRFGVSRWAIHNVLSKRNWTHV